MPELTQLVNEKRRSIRIDMESESLILHWSNLDNQPQKMQVQCIDISRFGMLLLASTSSLETQQQVRIQTAPLSHPNQFITANVRRIEQKSAQQYHIAVEIEQEN